MGRAGKIASIIAAFAEVSAQSVAMVIHYAPQSRVKFLLQTHLPSLTRGLVDAVDTALRKAYTVVPGKNPPGPETGGGVPEQQGPAFTCDLMGLKTSRGAEGGCA